MRINTELFLLIKRSYWICRSFLSGLDERLSRGYICGDYNADKKGK